MDELLSFFVSFLTVKTGFLLGAIERDDDHDFETDRDLDFLAYLFLTGDSELPGEFGFGSSFSFSFSYFLSSIAETKLALSSFSGLI